MTAKRILLIAGALACAAGGFLLARHMDLLRYQDRARSAQQDHDDQMAALRSTARTWAEAVAMSEGESVLKAFVAGISPAVLAKRRETIELAAVSLLRIPGVAGIHVLGTNGEILYSSDAKLTTTGEAAYRGAWALQASELVSRPSTRPGVLDFAVPIASGGTKLAVVWLEYDRALVRDAARPAELSAPAPAAAAPAVPAAAPSETVPAVPGQAPSEVPPQAPPGTPPEIPGDAAPAAAPGAPPRIRSDAAPAAPHGAPSGAPAPAAPATATKADEPGQRP